ncbi:unnamed protein product [Protopolystoma xenopodis]|uniref:BACK domain-containing protein n=1 Tax=Protopolystoma xenopodis TaxID=117903 RepID=A0A3S5BBH5_9PLAT|nr:unnamed protein product [Protopolystoma xenopodis]
MLTRRLGVAVAVLGGSGSLASSQQLYAVGGSDGDQSLSSVEYLDPRVGFWQRCPSMGFRRKHLGVAVYNGLIYAVGGRDDASELSSVECYDPRAHAWCPMVAMTLRRSGVGSFSLYSLLLSRTLLMCVLHLFTSLFKIFASRYIIPTIISFHNGAIQIQSTHNFLFEAFYSYHFNFVSP